MKLAISVEVEEELLGDDVDNREEIADEGANEEVSDAGAVLVQFVLFSLFSFALVMQRLTSGRVGS